MERDMDDLGDTIGSHGAWGSFTPQYKDTVALVEERLPRKHSSEDNLSECSTIPELSRTQEVELRREGREVNPLGQSYAYDDSLPAFKKPTFDIDEDELDSPDKRVSWPADENLSSTLRSERCTSMELIPESTRERTPRATGYTNKLMITGNTAPGLNSSRTVDTGNMQTNFVQTTRGLLHSRILQDAKIEQEDGNTGQPKQNSPEDDSPEKRNDFRQTTRNLFRNYQWDREETKKMKIYGYDQEISMNDQITMDRFDIVVDEKREKSITPCFLKGALFLICIMAIVGGIIAIAVVRRQEHKGEHGEVFQVNTTDPCPDVTLKLGEKIVFSCMFMDTEEAKEKTKDARNVSVIPPNRVDADSFKADRPGVTMWNVSGPEATCTSEGRYILLFRNYDHAEVYRVQINLLIDDDLENNLHTTIQQQQIPRNSTDSTEFIVNSSVSRVCRNYAVEIIGSKDNKSVTLTTNSQCSSNFTDAEGYSIACSTNFTDNDTDFNAGYPICQLVHTGTKINKLLQLPSCQPLSGCNRTCSVTTPPSDSGNCSSIANLECFDERLPIVSHEGMCIVGWCMAPGDMVFTNLTASDALCREWTSSTMTATTPLHYNVNTSTTSP